MATQRERTLMMWKKRDARSRHRVLEFKDFLFSLKEKVNAGQVVIPEDLREAYEHQLKVIEQI